ncbi:hypothetical protein NM208_g17035 [Fusarium decemcellulare]|uniref:Uncharacterized protein n=1 Tax=Fusarium decemcellulare TaxID=57161 RepID=A0ACC1R8J1_9HYPO|nr:hypothetical protein NM208_g17035 [Fusarium decemcellulare]
MLNLWFSQKLGSGAYIKELEDNPLRTKMLTAGTLAGAQELIASWLAKDRNKHGNYFTARVPKMSALRAKILQILVSNLIIAPIQNSVYLVAMALIAGARTYHQVRATVKVGFWKVMRVSWITSPICLAFAQKFLPDQLWVPFFNIVSFIIGTYINTVTKKKRLAALRKKHFGDDRRSTTSGMPPSRPEDYPRWVALTPLLSDAIVNSDPSQAKPRRQDLKDGCGDGKSLEEEGTVATMTHLGGLDDGDLVIVELTRDTAHVLLATNADHSVCAA